VVVSAIAQVEERSQRQIFRELWMKIYIPSLIFSTGQGAIIPTMALAARGLGASSAVAALVVALNGLGTMAIDIPAGWLVTRCGEKWSGWIATAVIAVGLVAALCFHNVFALAGGLFVAGAGWGIWLLVRLNHVSRAAPMAIRGRALSLLGGVQRAGNVIGPFIIVGISGPRAAHLSFLVYLLCALVGFIWLLFIRESATNEHLARRHEQVRPLAIVKTNPREFATAGTGTFVISLLRASRLVVVPLWGAHIGLSAGRISLIFALASIFDLSLFYPAGFLSDRFGRKAVALPCMILLSIGHVLLTLTHSFSSLLLVALLLGIGNGFGSGIVMTLGADRAPDVGRAAFLSVWRLVSDGGTSSGPLLDALVTGLASLAAAAVAVGGVGIVGAGVIALWLAEPEALSQAPPLPPSATPSGPLPGRAG
jgi:MFS family permease